MAVVIIILIYCAWKYAPRNESLTCDCARNDTKLALSGGADSRTLPPCDETYHGVLPYGHPDGSKACRAAMYNPFWPEYGAAGEFKNPEGYSDIPISRMIGDHAVPE